MNDECRMTNDECGRQRDARAARPDHSSFVIRHSSFPIRHSSFRRGFILLELVIALTIFSIAVLGLSQALTDALGVANTLTKEHAIRFGLKSFLEEARKKKTTSEMAMTSQDERLGVTYTSTIDDAGLTNKDGKTLANLYKLTAAAVITGVPEEQQPEPVTVYVYQAQSGR